MIAEYIQKAYAKPAYENENFNTRAWPGLSMVKTALVMAGYQVESCSIADVHEKKIVLVSITGACDWWQFLKERQAWKKGKYRVICGGAGVLNIRPFLWAADVFVFGRAERLIPDLIKCELIGSRLEDESVAYSDAFDHAKRYKIKQAESCFEHDVEMTNGKVWREKAIGCQRRCLFCGYTWQRRHIGDIQRESGASKVLWPSSDERTFFDLDLDRPETWEKDHHLRLIGLDGFSEKLRRKVNKPITRTMFKKFLHGLTVQKKSGGMIKFFNIVGYPEENDSDIAEFVEDIANADSMDCGPIKRFLQIHNTPFKPFPATPVSHWPVRIENFRSSIPEKLNKITGTKGFKFFSGKNFTFALNAASEGMATQLLDMITMRATEEDAEVIKKISSSAPFWAASAEIKMKTIEKYIDIEKICKEYERGKEPTAYLKSWWHND